MKMTKKTFKIIIFTIAITIFIGIIINTLFLFNPLTFNRDNITNYPYTWYRKPITIMVKTDEGNRELSKRHESAKFIYDELKKSEVLGSLSDNKLKQQFNLIEEGQLNIKSNKETTLTKIRWYGENSDICSTTGNFGYEAIVKITPELKSYLNDFFIK